MGSRGKEHPRNQHRSVAPRRSAAKATVGQHAPERQSHGPRRLLDWIVTANKAVLAAVGAGIIAAITASVAALPHLLANAVTGSPAPLTVAGGVSPNNSPPANPCSLQGVFVVPRPLHPSHVISTDTLSALVQNTADAASTSGTYTLQAQPNQTLVITAIHTVLIKRFPARTSAVDMEPADQAQCLLPWRLTITSISRI